MLDQKQVLSREDDETCQRAIENLNNSGIEAWREDGYLALGPHAIIPLPPLPAIRMISSFAYADGSRAGYAICYEEMGKDVSVALSDHEFTQRIDRTIPATFSPVEHQEWRKGFILGWIIAWCEKE